MAVGRHSLTQMSKGQGYVQYVVFKCTANGVCMSIRQLGFSNYNSVSKQVSVLPCDAMLAWYAIVVCSVCLCVCHNPVLYQNG